MKTFLKYFLIFGLFASSLCYAAGETPDVVVTPEPQEKAGLADVWTNLKQVAHGAAQNVLQATKDVATGAVQGAHQGAQTVAEKITPELFNKINKIVDQSEGYVTKAKYLGACLMISHLIMLGLCGVSAYNSFR